MDSIRLANGAKEDGQGHPAWRPWSGSFWRFLPVSEDWLQHERMQADRKLSAI
jgi:hypothetical protein